LTARHITIAPIPSGPYGVQNGRAIAQQGRCARRSSVHIARKDMIMGRKAGDRYTCSQCGSTIVYEKECPCCSESGHAEVCCDKPMDKVPA
jgi:hypothetical protein